MDLPGHVSSQIKGTLGQSESLGVIRQLLKEDAAPNRTALATRICSRFGFVDPRGRLQVATCLKALRDLEREGHFRLPRPSFAQGKPTPRRLAEAVPDPESVPAAAGDIQGLALVLVETRDQIGIWNEMMIREHPQGAGPLVGRQLRYLIVSEHGYLGGLGFASAALTLADRDRWIGWDAATRKRQLERVVGLSRFLIRPMVRCRNLASLVLGVVLRRIRPDFEGRYHLEPMLVESFNDAEAFAGTCYQAANWVKVGRTQGRGRQDRHRTCPESIKDIYVYPLRPDFRTVMGVEAPRGPEPLDLAEGVEGDEWAQNEFGGAHLGDRRLGKRLVDSARAMAKQPGVPFTGVGKGNWAAVKGFYRFIDHPEESEVTPEAILAPHRQRTVQRMLGQPRVLCIQDGSDLNFSGLTASRGLGRIGTNQTGTGSEGLRLHAMLAVTPEGLPLGILDARLQAPESRPPEDHRHVSVIPIEEKKTFDWVRGVRTCTELAARLPDTQLVCVMDREADFFELFDEQRGHGRVDLLVRAQHDRTFEDGQKFFDRVRRSPAQGRLQIPVPRQSARPKKGKQKAREGHPQRLAEVSLRYLPMELRPPRYLKDKAPLTVWVIHVQEDLPPDDVRPLEWFLLSTEAVEAQEEAVERLGWYALRWRIEDWHRVLKTGCRVEKLAFETGERLKRAVAINLVIAWRIMLMTLLGRESPELPAEVLFSDLEIRVLQAFSRQRKLEEPATLGLAVGLVARLGGYLGRTSDPPPGHELMWRGFTLLQGMSLGFALHEAGLVAPSGG
ncbi:MAG TPA: IS4 family transposase [Spirochaetia bacterium]|jgi:hypothetical protein|nr:IS4 family transposase [Spirochaetia bacterium]